MQDSHAWAPPEHPETVPPAAFSLPEEARGHGIVRAERPMPVWAWVQFPAFISRIRGFAVEWTADAVHVDWAQFGQHADAWVWRSAVKHRVTMQQASVRSAQLSG